ncbi:MAG: N-acetylmuramoyl-L-alanine amidase family protein, partial [Halanaerobiales bacterium]
MYLFLSINKKILIIILFFIAILSFYLYNKRVTVPSNSRDINFLVVIDPGHGGIDKGTNYGHVFEKDINLKIGKYLYQELIKVNIKALMTRKTDILYADSRNKDIKHRPQAANKNNANLFISIHANNFRTSQPSGSQVFYKKASDKSKKLAEDIHNELISLRKENNRCLKTGNYYVLNCTDCPAVLIETGFLSNPEDRRLLSSPDYQKRLAVKIKNGIVEYLRNEINNSEKNTASVYQTTQTIQQNIPSNKVVYFSQDNNVSLVTKNLVFPTNNFFSNDINEMNFTELLSISAIKQLMNPPENLCSP